MPITVDVVCRSCGRIFTPTPADYRRGTWRLCPACRTPSAGRTGQPRDGSAPGRDLRHGKDGGR